jgi:hypothetical protein
VDISATLQNLLLVDDWFIWIRDGNRVRRYTTEVWPEWLRALPSILEQTEQFVLANAYMIQFCKHHDFKYETRDNGEPITPEQFIAQDY